MAVAKRDAKAATAIATEQHNNQNNAVEALSDTLQIVLKIADPHDADILGESGLVMPAARRCPGYTPITTTTTTTIDNIGGLKKCLQGLCTTVFEALGKQQTEGAYQRALETELKLRGVAVEKEVPIDIMYRGVKIGSRRLDLLLTLLGDKSQAIIEMKAVKTISKAGNTYAHQIEYYMDVFRVEHGFLINFPHEAGFPPVPTGAVFRQVTCAR